MQPSEISTIRKYAAHTSWAKTPDRTARTAPARQAMFQKFLDAVDDRITNPVARQQAAESAYRAHFHRMAMRSAEARRAKRADGGGQSGTLFAKFLREVDGSITDPQERLQAAEDAYKSHFAKASLKARETRRARDRAMGLPPLPSEG